MIGVSGQLHSLTMRGSRGIRSKTALSQNKLTLQLISQRFSSEWISNNSSPKYFSTSSSMRHSFSVGNAFNQHSINTLTTRTFSTVIPFKLADIGEGIAEVELMKWFVKEGDNVKSFDRICEVQSDKATVEITSRYDGKIAKVHYAEGAIVKVGATLIDIQAGDSTGPKLVNEDMPNKAAPIETKAADLDDANIFNIHDDQVLTTPAVRKLAKENNIRLDMVKGTGPKGRIIKEDILSHIYSGNSSSTVSKQSSSSISTQLNIPSTEKVALKSENVSVKEDVVKVQPIVRETFAEDKRVPIRGIQRLMVKSMNAANQVKHLTLGEEIVCDKLVSLRKLLKDVASKQGIKLSYMPIIIKATSLALLQYPMLNATVAEDASEMVYHANHNIGVAIDTSKGLIVPVIKQVQRKSILEITEELNALQAAASKGQITEAQLSAGTFSLSNIGSIGGTYAVPVLVMPQVCIGALGRMMTIPRYVNKQGDLDVDIDDVLSGSASMKPVTIMNVSWSADHRVVDGATVARFSNTFKSYLESPDVMIANLR